MPRSRQRFRTEIALLILPNRLAPFHESCLHGNALAAFGSHYPVEKPQSWII